MLMTKIGKKKKELKMVKMENTKRLKNTKKWKILRKTEEYKK